MQKDLKRILSGPTSRDKATHSKDRKSIPPRQRLRRIMTPTKLKTTSKKPLMRTKDENRPGQDMREARFPPSAFSELELPTVILPMLPILAGSRSKRQIKFDCRLKPEKLNQAPASRHAKSTKYAENDLSEYPSRETFEKNTTFPGS